MTTTLRSTVRIELGWTWRDQAAGLLFTDSNRVLYREDLPDGVAPGQADAVYHALDQTLGAGQAIELVLDALEQTMFGGRVPVGLARVKALLVIHKGTSGVLVVGGASTGTWLGPFGLWDAVVRIPPGNPFFVAHRGEGWPVEPDAHRLRIEAVGGDIPFDLVLLGTRPSGNSGSSSSAWSSGTSTSGSSSSSAWSSSAGPSGSSSSATP